jgi:thiamine-monophosphate kinase
MTNKEIEFLTKIIKNSSPNSNLLKGNEDAIAFNSNKLTKKYLVTNIDSISWFSDALNTFPFTYKIFGRKIVTVTLSDICAKGAMGKFFLNSISVPEEFSENHLEELVIGMKQACRDYSLEFLGGDLGSSKEVVLTGIIIGESNELLYRKNCNAGDNVWVTGTFGFTGLAFEEAYNGIEIPHELRDDVKQKILFPKPKIKEGQILKKYANACIDSSDGLALSLFHISNESKKKIILNILPLDSQVKFYSEGKNEYNTKNLTLYAGEEFELVFTISPEKETAMIEEFQANKLPTPLKIGKVITGNPVVIDDTDSEMKELEIHGWDSLRNVK